MFFLRDMSGYGPIQKSPHRILPSILPKRIPYPLEKSILSSPSGPFHSPTEEVCAIRGVCKSYDKDSAGFANGGREE